MTNVTFGIIIPFRPKQKSRDWQEDNFLLNQTIGSVLRQTYKELRIYVIYTDEPEQRISEDRLNYVKFPFGFQDWDELPNRNTLYQRIKHREKTVGRWDKGRKLSFGAKLAKQDGCTYIMALDSDDLISKYLFSELAIQSNNSVIPGWYMDKGYIYRSGSGTVLKVPKYMCGLNGSTHILHTNYVPVPDFNSVNWADYNLFTDHGWLRQRIKDTHGVELLPVSRIMLLYVVHQSNMSQVLQKEFGVHFKALIKRLLRTRRLTFRLRDEFFISKTENKVSLFAQKDNGIDNNNSITI